MQTKEFFDQKRHDQTVNQALDCKIEGLGIIRFATRRNLNPDDLLSRLCHSQRRPAAYVLRATSSN